MTKRAVSILAAVVLILALVCGAAIQKRDPHRATLWTLYSDELSFAANVVPDIASNTTVLFFNPLFSLLRGEEVGNLWPIVSVTSPVTGPIRGISDVRHGYPFRDPGAPDEERQKDHSGGSGQRRCSGQTCTTSHA